MSGQQSPVAPESSKSEAVEPYSYGPGEKLWKDTRGRTGFKSYKDYVETYMEREDRSDLAMLSHLINRATASQTPTDACCIVDVLAQEDSPPKLSTRNYYWVILGCLQLFISLPSMYADEY